MMEKGRDSKVLENGREPVNFLKDGEEIMWSSPSQPFPWASRGISSISTKPNCILQSKGLGMP